MAITKEKASQIQKDLLCCAFEGGSNYWYCIEREVFPKGVDRGSVEYPHIDLPFMRGARLEISADGGLHANPDRKDGLWVLNLTAVERGWKLLREKGAHHYDNAITEDFDAETGDVFLQLCLFGEVIFG